MTGYIHEMTLQDLENELRELEQSYVEVLHDDMNYQLLHELWQHIKVLKAEIERRK